SGSPRGVPARTGDRIAAAGVMALLAVFAVLVRRRFARLPSAEVLVDEAHRRRPVADRGGDPLDRTVAGVSGGEDAGHGGLEREGRPIERPSHGCEPSRTTSRPVRM